MGNPNDFYLVVNTITVGPEGYCWAALSVIGSPYGRKIDRISPAGTIVHTYNTPLGANIGGMAVDGNLWFTDYGRNAIGKLAYGTSTFSRYPIPTPTSGVDRIVLGGDGALWFTESNANKIGRITTNGTITEYPIPTPNANPTGIAAGPSGAGKPKVIWFVEQGGDKLGKITIP